MASNATDDCSICLNNLAPGSALLTLACNHKFHLQCLASNVQAQNKTCPLCRVAIDPSVSKLLSGTTQPSTVHVAPPSLINFPHPTRLPSVNVS